jgi:uncharacterized protein
MKISNERDLLALYDQPSERARYKVIHEIDDHCRAFISASPLVMLATCGPQGADCSPRGGAPGFVEIATPKQLVLPDSKGNNRLDSLRNIIANPAVGLLFLVPGVNETLRVNGRATIYAVANGAAQKTVLMIEVGEAFIQCSKALVRADVWNPSKHVPRASLPSLGTILQSHTNGRVNAEDYDRNVEAHVRSSL